MAVSHVYRFLWSTGVVFVIFPHINLGLLSDYKICGDSECESMMSRVLAIRDHHGKDCRFLSFRQGDTIFVYHKLTGKREDLWAGMIDRQFGYFPKDAVKEEQVLATMEKVVETQKSDFFCMDDFGYPIDSTGLDSDDENDDDVVQTQGPDSTPTSPHTDDTDTKSPSTSVDPSAEIPVSDVTTAEEEDESKNAGGDAAAGSQEDAHENTAALNEKGGSPPSSWLGSSVTGWLGVGKEQESDNLAEEEKEDGTKETQAEGSLTSSMTGWLGFGGEGKPDDAVNSGEDSKETADSFTSTMTGWLGFGGEKSDSTKNEDAERETEEENEEKVMYRSRRMSLDLEGSQLHEEKKEVGTLDWLGDGLSRTLGFGSQESGEETGADREAEETMKEEKEEPASGSWLGIGDILGFRKDESAADEKTDGGFQESEEDKTSGHRTDSGNVDSGQTQPAQTEEEKKEPHIQRVEEKPETEIQEEQDNSVDNSSDKDTNRSDQVPQSEMESVTVAPAEDASDGREDNVLPADAAPNVDENDASPQTTLEEKSEAVGETPSVTDEERSAEMKAGGPQISSAGREGEESNREAGEVETESAADTDQQFLTQKYQAAIGDDRGGVRAYESDEDTGPKETATNHTDGFAEQSRGSGNTGTTEERNEPVHSEDAHSVKTDADNSDTLAVADNNMETDARRGESEGEGEARSFEDSSQESASEESLSPQEEQRPTEIEGDADTELKETENKPPGFEVDISTESGLKAAAGSEKESEATEAEGSNEMEKQEEEGIQREEKQQEVEEEQHEEEELRETEEQQEVKDVQEEVEELREAEERKEGEEQEMTEEQDRRKDESKEVEDSEEVKEIQEESLDEAGELTKEKKQEDSNEAEKIKEDRKQEDEKDDTKEKDVEESKEEEEQERTEGEQDGKQDDSKEVEEEKQREKQDEAEELKEKEREKQQGAEETEELKEEEKREEVEGLKEVMEKKGKQEKATEVEAQRENTQEEISRPESESDESETQTEEEEERHREEEAQGKVEETEEEEEKKVNDARDDRRDKEEIPKCSAELCPRAADDESVRDEDVSEEGWGSADDGTTQTGSQNDSVSADFQTEPAGGAEGDRKLQGGGGLEADLPEDTEERAEQTHSGHETETEDSDVRSNENAEVTNNDENTTASESWREEEQGRSASPAESADESQLKRAAGNGAFGLFTNPFGFFTPGAETEDPADPAPSLDPSEDSLTPERDPDPSADSGLVYEQDVLTDSSVATTTTEQQQDPPSSDHLTPHPNPETPLQAKTLSKYYKNLLAHMSVDQASLLEELFGRHKLQFLDYMLGSSATPSDDPDNDESILSDIERLLHHHREALVATAPQEKAQTLTALQQLQTLITRVRETFNTGKSHTSEGSHQAGASCVGASCPTPRQDQETSTEKDSSKREDPSVDRRDVKDEKNQVDGGSERESASHPHNLPGSVGAPEVVKQILDFAHLIAEESSAHVHAARKLLIWITVQVVSALPDDIRPGPDLYGVPWEPVIISSLVGLVTVLLFTCRCYSSVKSRMYRSKERWMADQVAQLLAEKCKVLETLSECQQEYDDLEDSLRDSGVLAQTQKTERLEAEAKQLEHAKKDLERDLEQLKDQLDQQKEHRVEQERRIAVLEENMQTFEEDSKELQSQDEQAQTTLKVYCMNSDRLQRNLETAGEENTLLQESNSQLRQQVEGWAERVSELEAEMRRCEVAHSGMQQDVANKDERIMSLTDRLLRMRAWDSDLEEEADEEGAEKETSNGTPGTEEENGRGDITDTQGHYQKVQKLIYAAKLNADLKSVDEDKDRVFAKLNDEVKAKEDLQVSIKDLENEKLSLQSDAEHYSDQVQRLQQKLQIMTEMYQENELKLHRLLTVEEKERLQKEEKLNKADKNIALAMEELNNYRQRAGEMEEELEKTKQSYQTQISAHEKKAHNNWLAARAADRELTDIRRENALLRQKLTDTQFKLDALGKDPYALDSLARPLPFRAERSPYGPSPLGRPASETRPFLSPPTLMDGPPPRLSPRVSRGPMEPPGGQGEMERSGPHSDSGSISPTWERDRRGPLQGPPGPLGPPGYMFPEPGGPMYRRPPPPGALGMGPPPGPLPPGPPLPHPRGFPPAGPPGPPHPADMADGTYRENSLGPGEQDHRESGPGDRRTPPEADPRMGGPPPPGPPVGPMDGPFPRRAPYGPPPPDFYPPRGPGGPPMRPMWAPPPPGMMFPPRFPPGGAPLPPGPHPHYAPPMRPLPPDGLPPPSMGAAPPPQQPLAPPPHSQPPEEHRPSPEDAI